MSKYTLKFTGKKGESGDKTDFSVSSLQSIDQDAHQNVPNPAPSALSGITFQLVEMRCEKGNYAPCRIDAVISVSNCPLEAEMDDIADLFAEKTVEITTLNIIQNLQTDTITLGSDYFVQKVNPVFQYDKAKGDTVPCTVNLVIYSRDYLLTVDRFSRSYLSQKLSSDILASMLKYGDKSTAGLLGNCMVDFESDIDRLQFTSLDDKELIQPYHVQYNEDFYSFIARIAARHGEFLFFEDGKLNLGLPHGKKAVSLDKRTATDNSTVPIVLSVERETVGDNPLEVESYYSNYLYREEDMFDTIYATGDVIKDQNEVAGKPIKVDQKKLYFNEDAYDEYFDVVGTTEKTAPDGMIMEQSGGFWFLLLLKKIIPLFPSTNHDTKFSRFELLAEIAKEIAFEETSMAARVKETNDLFLQQRVNVPVAHKDDQYGGSDNDKLCQFGSYTKPRPEGTEEPDSLQQYNFMKAFYASVREKELNVAKKVIKMKLRPGCAVLNVGDTVSFNKKKYVIVKVSAEYAFKPASDSVCIDVIEVTDTASPVCPPYDKCSEHGKAVPQVAVVSNHKDPRYLNRVRIKYPWQPDSDLASPWVRTATPLASPNGAACSFVMRAGSEVMVDYVDGNIDRPFIVGSMFTTRNNPTCLPISYGEREIRAESGARLALGMGNIATHVNNFVPFMSAVTPFISPLMGAGMAQLANALPMMGKLAGNATLTDAYGMFTISGDTASRSVTIDSAIGKVTVSALTGISISAPFGDVTIEAHNIKMRAANNITIESGLNIKDELDLIARQQRHARLEKDPDTGDESGTAGLIAKGVGDIVTRTLADLMLGAIDMSLFRIIYNAVSAPKEGTLKVKSHRFVNIEAGDGRAMDSAGGFTPKGLDAKHQVSLVDDFAEAARVSLRKRIDSLRDWYGTYSGYQQNANHGLLKTVDEIFTQYISGHSFSYDELYSRDKLLSRCVDHEQDISELIAENTIKACKYFKKYMDDFKKASGTLKGTLKPFPSAMPAKLVKSMRDVFDAIIREDGETTPDLALRLTAMSDTDLKALLEDFRNAVFRHSMLKCIGTDGFCIKWKKNYDPGHITIAREGVTPWIDPIQNIRVEFEDTSYQGHKVIRENFKNPFGISANAVNSVWHPLQKGRVLISEDPGSTLGLTANHNEWQAMDNLSVDFVRRFLAQR